MSKKTNGSIFTLLLYTANTGKTNFSNHRISCAVLSPAYWRSNHYCLRESTVWWRSLSWRALIFCPATRTSTPYKTHFRITDCLWASRNLDKIVAVPSSLTVIVATTWASERKMKRSELFFFRKFEKCKVHFNLWTYNKD